ncbi:MAG: hypothetical protein R3F51_13310 [Cyanobacteriota/Melainabacteria group bacterium]
MCGRLYSVLFLGLWADGAFLAKYGRWFLLKTKDLERADRWVDKYGDMTFLSVECCRW